MMGYLGYGGLGWIGMIANMLIMIVIVVGIVFLPLWAVRHTNANIYQTGTQSSFGQSAKEFAQARYAKGEITRDEYQQILTDLGK